MIPRNKIIGAIVFVFLTVYTVGAYLFSDQIATWIQSSKDPVLPLLLYYFSQPLFLLIFLGSVFYGFQTKRLTRYGIAGVLLGVWGDIVSSPHCVPSTGLKDLPANNFFCSDTIYIRMLEGPFGFQTGYALYYFVVPILLLLIASELTGLTGLTRFVRSSA